MISDMVCSDVWMKYTDKHGKSYTSHHRVWDKTRFVETHAKTAKDEGGRAEQITHSQFVKMGGK